MKNKVCACCGGELSKKDRFASVLSDGSEVCGRCVGEVRILYPKSLTVLDLDDDFEWIDPLHDVSLEAFLASKQRAAGERAARWEKYGPAFACFEVDETFRIIRDVGRGRKAFTDEYAITGTVLLGEIRGIGVLRVRRREKVYTKEIKRVELPGDERSTVMTKAEAIPEGCFGQIIVTGDAPYIYPGDVLVLK